jgi:phospholipase/carboxylesterase
MTSEFIHPFVPAKRAGAPSLLLLHGIGGDDNDLLQLGTMVSLNSALLSPGGRVLENGMPRFFRRLAEGIFDEEDVRRRALELGDFVEDARSDRTGLLQMGCEYRGGFDAAAAQRARVPFALCWKTQQRVLLVGDIKPIFQFEIEIPRNSIAIPFVF